jgi:hypothetical protein
MGIYRQIDLDFFDRVGRNNSCTGSSILVCRRILYGETCDTFITTDPALPHEMCETCDRMAVLCSGCSFAREDSTCAEYEPACRYREVPVGLSTSALILSRDNAPDQPAR